PSGRRRPVRHDLRLHDIRGGLSDGVQGRLLRLVRLPARRRLPARIGVCHGQRDELLLSRLRHQDGLQPSPLLGERVRLHVEPSLRRRRREREGLPPTGLGHGDDRRQSRLSSRRTGEPVGARPDFFSSKRLGVYPSRRRISSVPSRSVGHEGPCGHLARIQIAAPNEETTSLSQKRGPIGARWRRGTPNYNLMAVAPDARAGHTLGRYKLHEILGSGSMGVVYRGEHVYLGREVAIKVLRVGSARRGQAIKLFLREARAASRVSHHGIAAVTDFDKCADGTVFMAMELVRGEALDFLLERERRLAPERAINLVLQISDAIAAVHRHGIIHRDLKPANIMVRTRAEGSQPVREPVRTIFESIKLLDFGVANMYDPATGGWLAERRTIVG